MFEAKKTTGRRARRAGIATLAISGLLLAGCSTTDNGGANSSDEAEVLTTFTILEDMAQTIAGDEVKVHSLTNPGAEIHGYDPTPQDIAAASKSKLIISNGLGLEHWVDKLLQDSKATRVEASEGVEPINIAGTQDPNPHAWMSPKLALTYVNNIEKALADYKPEAKETFKKNADAYRADIQKVNDELQSGLSQLPSNERALVTCEGAFSYLAKDANLKEGYIWPVNTEGEITPQQIGQAAKFVKDNQVPAVFCESTVEAGPKEQLMRETGAADGGTLYVDSLSEKSGPVPTYLDLLKYDATTIVDGLTKAKK